MTRLVLVRHGDAAAGWADDLDPGLSDLGQQQARDIALELEALGPLPIITSPMRRCQDTAAPLSTAWSVVPSVDQRIGEIEAPDHDLSTRGAWLAEILGQRWSEMTHELQQWRDDVVRCLLEQRDDTVVFTHFVAINAAIGAATGDDRIMCRRVANCSTTTLEGNGRWLTLVTAPVEVTHTEVL